MLLDAIVAQAVLAKTETAITLSIFKVVVLILPIPAWGWVVSTVYDKHAMRFHLKREIWNTIHISMALGGLALALAIPALAGIGGFVGVIIGLAVLLLFLSLDLALYPMLANKDDRVPEAHRIKFDMSKIKEARAKKAETKQQGKVELTIQMPDKQRLAPPMVDTPEFELRTAAEKLFIDALNLRVFRLDLQPTNAPGVYAIIHTIDGVPQRGETMPAQAAVRIIDFWKTAGQLDVTDRRRRQVADIGIEYEGQNTPVRIRTSGAKAGPVLSMVFDQRKSVRRSSKFLGLLPQQLDAVKELVSDKTGHVVLIASPSGAGRTTTLYTVVKMHDAYTSNVQTLEFEFEDALEGVKQVLFDPTADGADYATAVRTLLRRDPDVLGIAEIDGPSAQNIVKADLARTRVYISIRGSSAISAIKTWVKAVGETDKAAEALRGVIAQKLVRKLCENCRAPYQPSPDMLKKLGLRPDQISQPFYKKGGQVLVNKKPEICPVCKGSGYIGQEGVFEIHPIGDEERAAIQSASEQTLRAALRKQGLPPIQQVALKKAVEGVTSIEEVIRVTTEAKPAEPKAAKAANS